MATVTLAHARGVLIMLFIIINFLYLVNANGHFTLLVFWARILYMYMVHEAAVQNGPCRFANIIAGFVYIIDAYPPQQYLW